MDTSFADANVYWKYIERAGITLDSDSLSRVARSLENNSWDNPTSAIELNTFAVAALIEAEQCQDLSLRSLYVEMALDALNQGVELYEHPLCVAHLALVLAMTGEIQQSMQTAFSTFIKTLHPAYIDEEVITPGIIYLPPTNIYRDSRGETLAKIMQAEAGYAQSLLLLSEVLCRAQLIFYNSRGLRLLHLAERLLPDSTFINVQLGIASIINDQGEGLLYLHRARELAPDSATVLQAIYLAYRDLGHSDAANYWLNMGRDRSNKSPADLDWKWSELAADSLVSYIRFEKELLLTVSPSLLSMVTSVLIAEGDWFEKEMEFWRSWIKPGMTVIDVGANVGVYTFSAALRVGATGCVLAVEPFSGCVRCLRETCRINQLSWVKVCAGAASSRNGTARLALYGANEFNEIVSNTEETMDISSFEEVTCFTLDSLLERENVKQVDFLKIDAENHELQVLAGSNRILMEFAPIILYENLAGSRGSNLDVADFLTSRGYQLLRYQPYLQQLITIDSVEDLQGRLNIIAMPHNRDKNP